MRDPLIAELAYRETVAALERVRAVRRAITLPLRVLAAVDLGGSVVVLAVGRFHLLGYFAPAFVTVLVVSGWWYRKYAIKHGVLLPASPWLFILLATLASGAGMSRLGVALDKPWISDFGPCLAFTVGTALTAAWLRSRRLALSAAGMVAASAVVSLVTAGDLAVALQLAAFGVLIWNASFEPCELQESS